MNFGFCSGCTPCFLVNFEIFLKFRPGYGFWLNCSDFFMILANLFDFGCFRFVFIGVRNCGYIVSLLLLELKSRFFLDPIFGIVLRTESCH